MYIYTYAWTYTYTYTYVYNSRSAVISILLSMYEDLAEPGTGGAGASLQLRGGQLPEAVR